MPQALTSQSYSRVTTSDYRCEVPMCFFVTMDTVAKPLKLSQPEPQNVVVTVDSHGESEMLWVTVLAP